MWPKCCHSLILSHLFRWQPAETFVQRKSLSRSFRVATITIRGILLYCHTSSVDNLRLYNRKPLSRSSFTLIRWLEVLFVSLGQCSSKEAHVGADSNPTKKRPGWCFWKFYFQTSQLCRSRNKLSRRLKKTNLIHTVYFFKSLWSSFYAFTTTNSFKTYVQRITNCVPLSL